MWLGPMFSIKVRYGRMRDPSPCRPRAVRPSPKPLWRPAPQCRTSWPRHHRIIPTLKGRTAHPAMILQCIAAWPATHVTETNEQSYRVKPARAIVTSAPPSPDFPKYLAWQTPHLRTTGYDRNSLGVAKYTR